MKSVCRQCLITVVYKTVQHENRDSELIMFDCWLNCFQFFFDDFDWCSITFDHLWFGTAVIDMGLPRWVRTAWAMGDEFECCLVRQCVWCHVNSVFVPTLIRLHHHRVSHPLLSSAHARHLGLSLILIDALLDLARPLVKHSSVALVVETWKTFVNCAICGGAELRFCIIHHRANSVFGIGPARRPGSPSPSEVAQVSCLIPVDSVGEAAGVVSEVAGEENTGANGVEGTFNKDVNDFWGSQTNRQLLGTNAWSHLACERAQREKVRVCAYGEVFSVHPPSRSWQLPLLDAKLPERTKIWEVCKASNGGWL